MASGKEGWAFERHVRLDDYDVSKYSRDRRRGMIT